MSFVPTPGTVYFVGAGPGAPDLITVRGRAIVEAADLVLYADSLVQASVAGLARGPGARIVGSADLHLDQIVALMAEAALAGGVVARVHTGDPALYGAIAEQMRELEDRGVPYEVVPGVTAAFAAAARLGVELTAPEVTQTLILGRAAGRTPVPEAEALRGLAAHGASLALYLSVDQIERVVAELLAGGAYTPDTPAAVVYKVTWPDELVVRGTLADIAGAARAAGLTRHALVMVGAALGAGEGAARSRLYDAAFAHGYRGAARAEPAQTPADEPPLAVLAVTRRGSALAAHLAAELGGVAVLPARFAAEAEGAQSYDGPAVAEVRRRWARHRQLVLIMSSGIAVRACAPLLANKASDPAVVCLDEAGRSVVPLLGGHRGGANELARRVAALTGGHAAITTASDAQGLPALDLLGREAGWKIDPESALTHAMGCLVNGEAIGCYVDPALANERRQLDEWLRDCPDLTMVDDPAALLDAAYGAALLVSHRALPALWPALRAKAVRYTPPALVAGLGCRRGVPADELRAALAATLADAGLEPAALAALATAEVKAEEPGLLALAAGLGVPLEVVSRERLDALDPAGLSPSKATEQFGLPGVAEPCALLAAGGPLLAPKRAFERCTVAVALRPGPEPERPRGRLTLVSLGPGDPQQMTLAAHAALRDADVVVGYQGYIDAIRGLLAPGQTVVASGMKTEMDRALQAIEQAVAGRRVALVSSGDIGVYAMAGPVFEALRAQGWDSRSPEVTVLPGISAFQAAAAGLGAAISHDFSVISLSDLLTPWELIERRVAAAAAGDFVVAFYNPRSRGRDWQLGAALEILRAHRPPTTPVAFARDVARPDERVILTTLAEADPARADMFTVVLVGNSRSYTMGDRLVTPRGYEERSSRERPGVADAHTAAEPSPPPPLPPAGEYPIVITGVAGLPALVVGGGAVGERKAAGLLAAGASVLLVSPEATARLREWAEAGRIEWARRPYAAGDARGARLVFAATDVREVNALVAREAAEAGALCNVADAPAEGDFHVPALHRAGGLTIAVSSGGAGPGRAAALRDSIARWLAGAPEKEQ